MALFRMKPHYRKSGGTLSYYGTAPNLIRPVYNLAATPVGEYVLFGGGRTNNDSSDKQKCSSNVTAYNKSFTAVTSQIGALWQEAQDLAATSVGDYALFGGGEYFNKSSVRSTDVINVYDKFLTKHTNIVANGSGIASAHTFNNYAVFMVSSALCTIDTSLTLSTQISRTSSTRYDSSITSINNYMLIGGGHNSSSPYKASNIVDIYDSAFTRTNSTTLSISRYNLAAASIENHALFGGGAENGSPYVFNTVDSYDSGLTRTILASLSVAGYSLVAVSVKDYVLFTGIISNNSPYVYNIIDTYDKTLTKTNFLYLPKARGALAGVLFGDYILFGGGDIHSGSYKTTASSRVDIYQYKH